MAYDKISGNILYVTRDGNYGGDEIIITSMSDFPEEHLERLSDLNDNSRFKFAEAVLNGEDLSQWLDE